jgi:hypothetical protein
MLYRMATWAGIICFLTLVWASQSFADQGDGFAILRVTTNGLSTLEGKGIKAGIEAETRNLGLGNGRPSLDMADDCFDDTSCRKNTMESQNLKWGLSVIVTRVGPMVQVSCALLSEDGNTMLKNENLINVTELEHEPVIMPAEFAEEMAKMVRATSLAEKGNDSSELENASSAELQTLEAEKSIGPNMAVLGAGGVLAAAGTLLSLAGLGYAGWQLSVAYDPTSSGSAKENAPQQFLVSAGVTGVGTLVLVSGAAIAGLSFTIASAE